MKKSLQQLFDEYMFECEFSQRLRPATLRKYEETISLLMRVLPSLTAEHIETLQISAFFRHLQERKRIAGKNIKQGIKSSTITTYWGSINGFFAWLKSKGHIGQNPLEGMRRPNAVFQDKKFIERQELERILSAIVLSSPSPALRRNLAIFYTLLYCGLRKNELLNLLIRDIDFEKKMLTVRGEISKNQKGRHIPLHSVVLECLKGYLQERKTLSSPHLLLSLTTRERLTEAGFKHWIEKINAASGVHFTAHQFRHTFAVNFLKENKNIAKLQQLLGHKDPSMTLHYVRCLPPEEMRGDIENMQIDKFL